MPSGHAPRQDSITELAHTLHSALQDGQLERVLAPARVVRGLAGEDHGSQLLQVRQAPHPSPSIAVGGGPIWQRFGYDGFCAQGEDPGDAPRAADGSAPWWLGRLLVVGRSGNRRAAAWLEGIFAYTDRGWKVLVLHRVEDPRVAHADLELATCDVASRGH